MKLYRLLYAVALSCAFAWGQTAQPLLQPRQFFPDGSGAPCSGCSLYSYAAGTNTPQATYTDPSGVTQNTNPVILDVAGTASIWVKPSASYKYILKDALGNTIWTKDNVTPMVGLTTLNPTFTGTLAGPNATLSGSFTTGSTNGVVNVALQTGTDVCAQIQNAAAGLGAGPGGGAGSGGTAQSTAFGVQPNCASGLTIGHNAAPWGVPFTLNFTSPSSITLGGKALVYQDNFRLFGPGGSANQAQKWSWVGSYSGPGLQIGAGDGAHNPQGTVIQDLVLAPTTSTVTPVEDVVSNFYPFHRNVHADCPNGSPNLGQIGQRFRDSTAGTMGYGLEFQYESVNCDIGMDLEGSGNVANNLNTHIVGDIVGGYVGVAAGVESGGSGATNFIFDAFDIAPVTYHAQATVVSRDVSGLTTITTAARSPEIFSVDKAHYVSITGVTGMSWPVNTISTVASATCGANGLITINLTYQMPITPLTTQVAVTGIGGYSIAYNDQSPNGVEMPVTVNAGHTQFTYYSPCNTGDTYDVSSAKVAIAPFLINSVPNNTSVTFFQNGSPVESGTTTGASWAGTVGICYLFGQASRMTIRGGLCESSSGQNAEPAGSMTVGVWAKTQANSISCDNISIIGTDFPFLDQTTTRDTRCSANVAAWSQNIPRFSSLQIGKTNQSVIDTPEVNGSAGYLRIRAVGSDPTVGLEVDDQNMTAQLQVGTTGPIANQYVFGPKSLHRGVLGGTTDAGFLQAPISSTGNVYEMSLTDHTGAPHIKWGLTSSLAIALTAQGYGVISSTTFTGNPANNASITAWSIAANNVPTFTATNLPVNGSTVTLYNFGTSTFFNQSKVLNTVQGTGTFTGSWTGTHAIASGTETGVANPDLNDAMGCGTYSGTDTAVQTINVVLDATGATDTFKWQLNGGSFTTGVAITPGVCQVLTKGVGINFAAPTGHTLNDSWSFTVTPTGTSICSADGTHCSVFANDGTTNFGCRQVSYLASPQTFTNPNSASITAWSITSNVPTFTATSLPAVGDIVLLSGFGTSTFFNGTRVAVTASGGGTFTGTWSSTHADGSATESGTGISGVRIGPLSLPALSANSTAYIRAAILGRSTNTGTIDPIAYIGNTAVKDFTTFTLHTTTAQWELGDWTITALGSTSSQQNDGHDNVSGSGANYFTPVVSSVNLGTGANVSLYVWLSVPGDAYTAQYMTGRVCQ